jgi:DNA polymerase V
VGLKGIYRPGFRYKKCGVLFLDLHQADSVQGSLFLRPDQPERVRLMDCVDQLNARYGRDRVRFACSGQDRPWKLRAEYPSQGYTTRCGELLAV